MRNRRTATLTTLTALFFVISGPGCSDAQKQEWNEFWGISEPAQPRNTRTATPAKSTARTQRTAAQRPPAEQKSSTTAARPAEKPAASENDDVDQNIEAYAANMNPPRERPNQPNDYTAKIRRQQDPNRQKRIHDAASQSDPNEAEPEPGYPSGSDPLDRYERNTGVSPRSPVRTASDDARASDAHPEDGHDLEGDAPDSAVAARGPQPPSTKPPADPARDKSSDSKLDERPSRDANQSKSIANSDSARAKPRPDSADETANDDSEEASISANAGKRELSAEPAAEQKSQPAAAVPELVDVSVTAAPESAPPSAEASENTPAISANAAGTAAGPATVSLKDQIVAQEKTVAADPNNIEEQYRLRMMYLIDGQDEKAKSVIPGVDADLQQIITAQIESLISARSTSGRDPATWATRQLDGVEELRRLIKERADLLVPKVVLCTEVEGFGRYKPIEPAEFKAGRKNRVLIYMEIDNFTSKKTNSGMYRTLLSTRQTLMTADGKEIWTEKAENIEDLARRPRRDFYLCTTPIVIPRTLPPGDYLLKVEVEDMFAGKINSNVATFKLVP